MQVRHCMCARPLIIIFIGEVVVYIYHAQLCTFGSNQDAIDLQTPRDEMVRVCV